MFALLVAPPATAQLLTARTGLGLALSVALGVLVTWLGLALAYFYELPRRLLHHHGRVRDLRARPPAAGGRSTLPGGCRLMFAQEFFRNALLAGSFVALACGLVGYFVVLRAQVFAGDALSHVAFTGAIGAAAAGLDTRVGLFAATISVALILGAIGPRAGAEDVAIGVLFAWVLGLGVLFLALFSGGSCRRQRGARCAAPVRLDLRTQRRRRRLAAVVGAAIAVPCMALARPLLFASVDPIVASSRGVRVRALGSRSWRSWARPPRRPPRPWGRC